MATATPDAASADASNLAYTCCNLRYEGDWISDANPAPLPFIPAGARIELKDYGRKQETKEQLVARLMVKEDPRIRIASFDQKIQAAIRAGKVMPGMTKEQVIMSLGYPRTDLTRSLDAHGWTYSTYEEDEYVVRWGSDQRVEGIDGLHRAKGLVLHIE